MKYVELVPGVKSSVLGFGCAPILGAVDRKRSIRALEVALEEGITHFDVAPSYGFGEAESLVGSFLQGKRNEVVLATKFGIEVSPIASIARPLKSSVRLARKLLKSLKGSKTEVSGSSATPSIVANLHKHVPITGPALAASFERSLKRLRTDYIDFLFLHDPSDTLSRPDDVLEELRKLKQAGKLRGTGIAVMAANLPAHVAYIDQFDIIQFEVPQTRTSYDEARLARSNKPCVLFSPFRARGSGKVFGPETTSGDLLKGLAGDYPLAVILCSMFSEGHLRENSRVF